MNSDLFYDQLTSAAVMPPHERHNALSRLHTAVYADYQAALRSITPERAASQVGVGEDRRSVLQVVGHIMEWERFMILGAADILAGLEQPRMVASLSGYVDEDGSTHQFNKITEFNVYQAQKHAAWSWEKMLVHALESAAALHTLFTYPQLLSAARLERTRCHQRWLMNGAVLSDFPMGWSLWTIALEHTAVEHTRELGMPG